MIEQMWNPIVFLIQVLVELELRSHPVHLQVKFLIERLPTARCAIARSSILGHIQSLQTIIPVITN